MSSEEINFLEDENVENFDANEFEETDEKTTKETNVELKKNAKAAKSTESTSGPTAEVEAETNGAEQNGTEASASSEQPQLEEQKSLDERSVFIRNIGEAADSDQLKLHFETCGAVERVTILTNKRTGEQKGCAFVQFKSKVGVANALLLDGKPWQDKTLEVKPKRTNLPFWMRQGGEGGGRGRGRGRGRGSFRGNGRGGYQGSRGRARGRGQWHPYGETNEQPSEQ
jgi:polyadenylate-binding protein 2